MGRERLGDAALAATDCVSCVHDPERFTRLDLPLWATSSKLPWSLIWSTRLFLIAGLTFWLVNLFAQPTLSWELDRFSDGIGGQISEFSLEVGGNRISLSCSKGVNPTLSVVTDKSWPNTLSGDTGSIVFERSGKILRYNAEVFTGEIVNESTKHSTHLLSGSTTGDDLREAFASLFADKDVPTKFALEFNGRRYASVSLPTSGGYEKLRSIWGECGAPSTRPKLVPPQS